MPNMQSMMSVVDPNIPVAAGLMESRPQGGWRETNPSQHPSDDTYLLENNPRPHSVFSDEPPAPDSASNIWQSSQAQIPQAAEYDWPPELTQGLGDLDEYLTGFAFDSNIADPLSLAEGHYNNFAPDDAVGQFRDTQHLGDFTPALQNEIDCEQLQPATRFLFDSHDGDTLEEN